MQRQTPGNNAKARQVARRWSLVVALTFLLAIPAAFAQATWVVESLIPDALSIRVPTTTISFAFDTAPYPPESFPARYPASEPSEGRLPLQVFSNVEGVWSILLEVPDLIAPEDGTPLPSSQLLYRVNEGVWLRADGSPQVIYTASGPTVGWFELHVDFALELTGNERAGSYVINAVLTGVREPAF